MYVTRTAYIAAFIVGASAISAGPLIGQDSDRPDPSIIAAADPAAWPTGEAEGNSFVADRQNVASPATPLPEGERSVVFRRSTDTVHGGYAERLPVLALRQDRRGVPWIIAGSALIVGGAIVGDDIGSLLMAGGVGVTAYGLYIYF